MIVHDSQLQIFKLHEVYIHLLQCSVSSSLARLTHLSDRLSSAHSWKEVNLSFRAVMYMYIAQIQQPYIAHPDLILVCLTHLSRV